MAHHSILTDDELAMLQELGSDEGTHLLSGHLDNPMLGLLQRADSLSLEAHLAGHQLVFPMSLTQRADGFVEPRISAPVIRELGFPQPRPWRLDQQAWLQAESGLFKVPNLSLNGLIVENLPADMVANTILPGSLCIEDEAPFPLQARLVRQILSTPAYATWAVTFEMSENDMERLRHWQFLRHQAAFNQAYLSP